MIRAYLKIIGVFLIIFAFTIGIAKVVGATQPPNPALAGFSEGCEEKAQPCWYGIVPGVTTNEDALKILQGVGFTVWPTHLSMDTCTIQWGSSNNLVGNMELRCNTQVRLVELMSVLGIPTFIDFMGHYEMSFHEAISLDEILPCSPDVSDNLFLSIYPSNFLAENEVRGFHWHGFVSAKKYHQLEPDSNVACVFYRNLGI